MAEQIGVHFTNVGIFLLNDDTGALVEAIARQHMNTAERINTEILRRWLQGSGRQPVVWRTLIGSLNQAGLPLLAENIEKRLRKTGKE